MGNAVSPAAEDDNKENDDDDSSPGGGVDDDTSSGGGDDVVDICSVGGSDDCLCVWVRPGMGAVSDLNIDNRDDMILSPYSIL